MLDDLLPRTDLSAHTHRLASGVGKGLGIVEGGQSLNLVGPASVVTQGANEGWDIERGSLLVGLAGVQHLNGGHLPSMGL